MARGLAASVAAILLLGAVAIVALQTGWTKNLLRGLIVRQANQYLTATLDIGNLDGSLLRGVELRGVTLSRAGETVVSIDRVALSYSIPELFDVGTTIRRIELDGLRIAATRDADGQWNLQTLVKQDPTRPGRRGPARPITVVEGFVRDASISITEPVTFGATHLPTQYRDLDVAFAFDYDPGKWTLDLRQLSLQGDRPQLSISSFAGAISSSDEGWDFRDIHLVTPRSDFVVRGRVGRETPRILDLRVNATRFAFQEWSGVVPGLSRIAIDAAFDAHLAGPVGALETSVALRSNGGDVQSDLVLDTSVPGWHGKGKATVRDFNLALWFSKPEQRSTITGASSFDLDLDLGGHFPRGNFTFTGPYVAFFGYEAANVVVRGALTGTEVRIASATARAYGAAVSLAPSTLTIDRPFAFRFVGRATDVDLRQLPANIPVPHVESTLAMDFDVEGQFASPYLRGSSVLDDSVFLGASVAAGATGFIDTQTQPLQYRGAGRVDGIDLHRFGDALDIQWLREPRYAGTVSGSFHVDGSGSDLATMALEGGGRMTRATMFGGELANADVSVSIANGSLDGAYDGEILKIDPSLAMADERYAATLTGRGRGRVFVCDLLLRSPVLNDYAIDASLDLHHSSFRGFHDVSGRFDGGLNDGVSTLARLSASSPAIALEASGTVALDATTNSHVDYDISRGDLAQLEFQPGRQLQGEFATRGTLTGPLDAMNVSGSGTLTNLATGSLAALSGTVEYDATIPAADPLDAKGRVQTRLSFIRAFGRELRELSATATYDAGRASVALETALAEDAAIRLNAAGIVDANQRSVQIDALTFDAQPTAWRLDAASRPRVSWTDGEVRVEGLRLSDAAGGPSSLAADGTWRPAGGGVLHLVADDFSIDSLTAEPGAPPRWGGTADVKAAITGSSERPLFSATFDVTNGRVRRLPFDRFAGRIDYADEVVDLNVRLDQATDVWLTAVGRIPRWALEHGQSQSDRAHSDAAMHVEVHSSQIELGLLEGISDTIRNVSGRALVNVVVVGTADDPHFDGQVDVSGASFEVVASGARYKNGRLALALATDRVEVQALHLEDDQGHPLDIRGSLATHELRVQDLEIAVTARAFRMLKNEFGQVDVDADLTFRGEFEAPRLQGRIALTGGYVSVDRVLDRTLSQPYATNEVALPELDPLAALNPWERMGLDVQLSIPGTLRMTGENVQLEGAPLGLGDFNLRAVGDLYLYKDPGQPLYVNGSFDSVTGTYAFQGRRFDLDPNSSINFRGDLFPEVYVMVRREISGVETRVTISGTIRDPELVLASTPPLDPSDILSLIVFNTSTNALSALQQQQLAVRAGTIAAGFIAAPMLGALERSLGIDTLEIEPGADIRGGARVTVGNEIAPGLVARFSRQFGSAEYSEAVIEYYLSRVLSLRARFSDAGTLVARTPFRRVERAGIDLLFFFSF